MYIAIMILHALICVLMIAIILFQRSEGGGLASSGTGVVSARGRADLLTRTTAILAAGFFTTSLVLTFLAGGYTQSKVILDPLEKPIVSEDSSSIETKPSETPPVSEENL